MYDFHCRRIREVLLMLSHHWYYMQYYGPILNTWVTESIFLKYNVSGISDSVFVGLVFRVFLSWHLCISGQYLKVIPGQWKLHYDLLTTMAFVFFKHIALYRLPWGFIKYSMYTFYFIFLFFIFPPLICPCLLFVI